MSKKVVSYSLYGSKQFYCQGAVNNAKRKSETYGTDWETWFYVYQDVPQNYIDQLKEYGAKVIPIDETFPIQNGTMWRFLAIDDPEVDIMLVRDVDSIPIQKELDLVNEWLATDKQFHIIRDATTHQMPFLACSFGIRKSNNFSMLQLFQQNPQFMKKSNIYIFDQLFLAHVIYPLTVGNRLVHDSFNHYELDGFKPLERTDRFIGEKILEDGTPEGQKELDQMQNRYIYFHRNIDLYNTEQFGAFLYEFMENLQIARKYGRTLVIPNVLIAPRNNEKILAEKHIYIKSLSLVPITDYLDLNEIDKRYVRLLPLAEFYEKTYSSPAIVLYNPQRLKINEYIVNGNELLTPFGKMKVAEQLPIDTFGLNLVGLGQNENFKGLNSVVKNIIVLENGRLGQPNWHPENLGLDYFWIRMSIMYHQELQDLANRFVLENGIREKQTLMVHWRRGDRILTSNNKIKYELHDSETDKYFNRFTELSSPLGVLANILSIKQNNMEISQVFLVTNNADLDELDFLKKELLKFNINTLEYINHDQQEEGLVQQIIGAQCKYQLHGPTSYERMSAFGRWMIEERKRYYFNRQYITTMEVFDDVYFIQPIV